MENNQVNKEVIETARQAWNKVSKLVDVEPIIFSESEQDLEEFETFYYTLVTTLFEEETAE